MKTCEKCGQAIHEGETFYSSGQFNTLHERCAVDNMLVSLGYLPGFTWTVWTPIIRTDMS
jgi:hypothetical protein